MKLLGNNRIDTLSKESDSIGILDKGQHIKTFFESIKNEEELKMFCIYGEWGSGKSSLLKYLENELGSQYNTFFFEAWEYDHTENIAFSLLEFLVSSSESSSEQICGDFLKTGAKFLKGIGKAVKFEVDIPLVGKASIDGKEFVSELEREDVTYTKVKAKFKEEFVRWEDSVTIEGKSKYNLVFIDDLDRCTPEQTLALLSSVKLFFNYGTKTKFLCAIDKKAVQEAIKTRYHDYLKSSEYLEKIFDITFNMPNQNDLDKLIYQSFKSDSNSLEVILIRFFKDLKFTNPRKVKKVINKYKYLSFILLSKKDIIPNIYVNEERNNYNIFETIYTIYLIILHEFYKDVFNITLDVSSKLSHNNSFDYDEGSKLSFLKNNYSNKKLGDYMTNKVSVYQPYNQTSVFRELWKVNDFLLCIVPFNIKKPNSSCINGYKEDLEVTKDIIELYWYHFMHNNMRLFINDQKTNNSSLLEIKNYVDSIL